MAIVKMKRLRLAAMQQDREELLHLLQRMGCVEIDELSPDPEDPRWQKLSRPKGEGLAQSRDHRAAAEQALGVLKRYAPEKKPMLAPRPELSVEELLAVPEGGQAEERAAYINGVDRRMTAICAEQAKKQEEKNQLRPWAGMEIPLELTSTQQVTVLFGTLPAALPFEQGEQVVKGGGELAQLTRISADRDLQYLLLVCHNSQSETVLEGLKELGWSRANLRGWTGTAEANMARIDGELEQLERELEACRQELSAMGGELAGLRRLADRYEAAEQREQFRTGLMDTQQVFFLEGWIPDRFWPQLEKALEDYPAAAEVADPTPEEYPAVPVKLENNWFTRPLNMVTEMYSLPAYGSLDPNPLMAPFFIFFYGFMMADMGYGLVMILASLIVMKKAKPDGPTMRYMVPLLGLGGVATFIMGAMTGGFFGDLLPQLAMMLDPNTTFTAMPALFSPLDDALMVLIGSLCIGLCQIFTGMAVSMYRQIKKGETVAALCNEGAWFAVFALAGVGFVTNMVKPAIIAILVLLILTQGYGKKGIVGKLMGIGGSLYNNVTGYFSDILSYSRLMALMLAGAVIAQVFNTLGALTGNIILFFIIAMIGNTLNFALNLLGCYVHDMRLQCLEYFGRFYEDGGKPFQPLELNTKYYKIVK